MEKAEKYLKPLKELAEIGVRATEEEACSSLEIMNENFQESSPKVACLLIFAGVVNVCTTTGPRAYLIILLKFMK